jgi:hypothetical protein
LLDVIAAWSRNVFELAGRIRWFDASVHVILAGTVDAALERAGDLCQVAQRSRAPMSHH